MPPRFKKKKKSFTKRNAKKSGAPSPEQFRVRLPRETEVLGILDQRLGASRVRIRCLDGKTRVCRIPGRLKRRLWVRAGDIVLVEPWEYGGDGKGDVIFKYRDIQVEWLRRNGYLDQLVELDEF